MDVTSLIAQGEFQVNPGFTVIGMAIGAGVGYLIGKNKGRGVLGAVLGGLLGCIGWIIVAVLSPVGGKPQS